MKQAMIFAAGLGTRLRPLTDTMPKALVKVGGVTLLDRTIQRLHTFGYSRFVVNVHHFSQQIIDHIAQNELYSRMVQISDESDELFHSPLHVDRQIGIHVIIVSDGVWRTRLSLDHHRRLPGDAGRRIVGRGGMADDACQPYMGDTHLLDTGNGGLIKVIHFSASILMDVSIDHRMGLSVAKQPRENLIYDRFLAHHDLLGRLLYALYVHTLGDTRNHTLKGLSGTALRKVIRTV